MAQDFPKKLTFDEYYKDYFLSQKYFFDFATRGAFIDVCELRNGSRKYCFEFKKQENLPCPCCGKIMTTRDELLSFIENVKTQKGIDLSEEISKYQSRLRGVELKIAKRLIILAPKYPEKNLKDLFILMYRNSIKQLEKSQQKVILKINKLSNGLEGQTFLAVKKDITFVSRLLRKRKNTQTFKRKTFIAGFYKLLAEEENERNKKILEIISLKAKKLPTSGNSIDAFIVKYHRRSMEEIAQRLLDSSLASTEHIMPRADGGVNDPSNYLVQCKYCNNERSSMSYRDWLKRHPEMKRNIQIYMDKVINLIVDKKIQNHDFYPLVVKSTILKESEGLLDIRICGIFNYLRLKYLAHKPT
ncbi:MAG: HNH endonuclease [Candidatus Gastranaerophilales bacterium]|nr:HNH endonuclease [Candidatus Gastranaerophilales bacterium]